MVPICFCELHAYMSIKYTRRSSSCLLCHHRPTSSICQHLYPVVTHVYHGAYLLTVLTRLVIGACFLNSTLSPTIYLSISYLRIVRSYWFSYILLELINIYLFNIPV